MDVEIDHSQALGLRQQLIGSGLEILREEGLQGLTLRACAARCGVSHAAPAYHFNGFQGLLSGIAASGFDQLADAMELAKRRKPPEPRDQLLGMCEGYLGFANSQPSLFTLMFNSGLKIEFDETLKKTSGRAYGLLQAACQPFEPPNGIEGTTETMVWSLVHGFASLQIGGRFRMPDESCDPPAFDALLPSLKIRDSN